LSCVDASGPGRFERLVVAVIVANSVVMLLALIDHRHEELLENAEHPPPAGK
jgi:hypothetical protein